MIEAELLFPLLAGGLALLGIPQWIAMVGPNRFYGVRTPATLGDEAVWYAVNRAAGRDLVFAGGAGLLLSLLLPGLGVSGAAYAIVMALVLAAGSGLAAVVALARVRRLRL
jgi:uncharacterized membrane protein